MIIFMKYNTSKSQSWGFSFRQVKKSWRNEFPRDRDMKKSWVQNPVWSCTRDSLSHVSQLSDCSQNQAVSQISLLFCVLMVVQKSQKCAYFQDQRLPWMTFRVFFPEFEILLSWYFGKFIIIIIISIYFKWNFLCPQQESLETFRFRDKLRNEAKILPLGCVFNPTRDRVYISPGITLSKLEQRRGFRNQHFFKIGLVRKNHRSASKRCGNFSSQIRSGLWFGNCVCQTSSFHFARTAPEFVFVGLITNNGKYLKIINTFIF